MLYVPKPLVFYLRCSLLWLSFLLYLLFSEILLVKMLIFSPYYTHKYISFEIKLHGPYVKSSKSQTLNSNAADSPLLFLIDKKHKK